MSVFICLVVVALLAPSADSAICVSPDQYEVTLQQNLENYLIHYDISIDSLRKMEAITICTFDENKKLINSYRIVSDYNATLHFNISDSVPCVKEKLSEDFNTEIPDDAVKVDHFPVPLPPDLPEGIEYWRFNETIVGVLSISPQVCAFVVIGYLDTQGLVHDLLYISGNYSLSIRNSTVFDVPPDCLS